MTKQRQFYVLCTTVVMLAMAITAARSDSDLEKAIKNYDQKTVVGYIQPLADLFGADLNAGFAHNAYVAPDGFHFKLEIIGMGAVVSDNQKTYTATDPWGGTFKTATVYGGKGATQFNPYAPNDPNQAYRGSDGIINASILPLATPQLTIGSLYGTEGVLRYVPIPANVGGSNLPAITLFGIGARHSISQYLPDIPIDMSANFMYNKFTIGDVITTNAWLVGFQASKEFSILLLYGGLQYEKTTVTLTFNSTTTGNPLVNIDLDAANNFRATIGAGLNLFLFRLYADANFGNITNFSAGIGFGF